MDDETIKILINKIENGLPDIKLRSISTLYTKITVGLIEHSALSRFINLPGVLLQWINDNRNRSEPLFKVLTILSYFMKTEEGLLIMKQYQALDFFQQYRKFLLEQQPRHDQYTTLLQNLSKLLIPLQNESSNTVSQIQAQSNIKLKQEKYQKQKGPTQKEKSLKDVKQGINICWIVVRQSLGKKQQDELYALMMQLRHSKRELQLQWLKKIEFLVKYWGYKYFRFRNELIDDLTQQFSRSNLKWLIIDILKAIIRGIGQNARLLLSEQSNLVILNSNQKYIRQPQVEKATITFKKQLFGSIYSFQLIDQLIKYNNYAKQTDLLQSLIEVDYKYSPKYFLLALSKSVQTKQFQPNLQSLNKSIQYYCSNFDKFSENISYIFQKAPSEWNLTADKFPILKRYIQNMQKSKKITFLSKYKQDWQFGSNLHNAIQVINNLKEGVQAIDNNNHNIYIPIYVNTLLTLGVAVQKQDPLMSYYPLMKSLIIKIAQKANVRKFLYQQILKVVSSANSIKYGCKKFSQADLSIIIFSEETMLNSMFYESFGDENSLQSWLQVITILVNKSKQYCQLSSYASLLFSLSYHKNEKIRFLSKHLMQGLSAKGKLIIKLCKLFSVSEQQRLRTSKDLFGQVNQIILAQQSKTVSYKKLLKINENTIQSYIQIIFNSNLQEDIRLNATKQLLQSIQRIQLNPHLEQLLTLLSQNIVKSINQFPSFSQSFLVLFIQINHILNQILRQKFHLKTDQILSILQTPLPAKIVRLLIQQLYIKCFQSPFSNQIESHYITLIYPHINFMDIKISGQFENKENTLQTAKQIVIKSKLNLPNFEETLEYIHFIQQTIYANLNQIPIRLSQTFVNIVEKQIGSVLHASKGYIDLHYLAYGLNFLSKSNLAFPDKILDYSLPLLNSLLAKDQSPFNCEPIALMISIIGCKKTRQLNSLLSSNPSGLWKYIILLEMQTIDVNLLELIIKGLVGLTYGKQAVLILRLAIKHAPKMVLNEFSQSLLLSNSIKFIRQQTDQLLRNTAVCLLTEMYKSQNLECQGWEDIFGSVATLLLDQTLNISHINLVLNLIKTIIHKNDNTFKENSIMKMLLDKLIKMILIPSLNELTGSIIFEMINIVALKERQLLQKYELVDAAISIISNICDKKTTLNVYNTKIIAVTLDYLFVQSNHDQSLPKYLMTSTNLLKYLVKICKHQQITPISTELFDSIGRIIITISNNQEDLFIYKLNQIIVNESKSFLDILNTNINRNSLEYLKMIGWILVIHLRNRQKLDQQQAKNMAQIGLNSECPIIIKSIMPFSIEAKLIFMQSKYFQQLIKENNAIIDNRLIKQVKDKKKKNRNFKLQQKQSKKLESFLSILSALFYSADNLQRQQMKQSQGLKKILIFIEKMYSCGQWQEQITIAYLKVVTNMALSPPFANICSNRFSQNAIMIEQMIGCILKSDFSDGLVKLSLKLMSFLIHFESIRSSVLRAKVIQELSTKLIKNEQNEDINLEYIMSILQVFISFSAYKDSNIRLLNDKRLLQVLLRIIKLGRFSILQERIVILLSNLACFKSNKSTFMSNRDIHKIILGLLQDKQISYHSALLSLLYNILYKNSAALKLYRRKEVIEVVKSVSSNYQSENNKALLQALLCEQTN